MNVTFQLSTINTVMKYTLLSRLCEELELFFSYAVYFASTVNNKSRSEQ
jgi:hypothetical protein